MTALADEEAMDGVELETLVDPATPDNHTETDLSHLTEEQRRQLMELLDEYRDIFRDVPEPAEFQPYHLDTGQ